MRVFKILNGTHKGKSIHVIKYEKQATGQHIEIKHNVPTETGKKLRWVQSLSSNHPEIKKCKSPQVVDPFGSWDPSLHKFALPGVTSVCKADDLKPYYMTDSEFTGIGPNLKDSPKSPAPATGRYWWKFITTLAEVTGSNVQHLVGITWGYDRKARGDVNLSVIQRATTSEIKIHNKALKTMYSTYVFS